MFAVNEFEDVKFTDELVFEVNEISPNVKFPPCAKVGLVPEQTIDELAAFKVKFVKVPMPTTVPAVNVTVLEPSVIVLTLLLLVQHSLSVVFLQKLFPLLLVSLSSV